jgi:hypothetical protein
MFSILGCKGAKVVRVARVQVQGFGWKRENLTMFPLKGGWDS